MIVGSVPIVTSFSIKDKGNFENQLAPLSIDWWPMFRHDTNHIGISTSSAPDENDVLWLYQTGGFITSSPAVLDGKVYIGSGDNKLYCFDMMNGDILWDFTTGGYITASPAVANGKVYIGSQDTIFYCLDSEDGSQIWEFDTDFMIESSPTIKDGKVIFGSSGALYCLDADDGNQIWDYETKSIILSSPAVYAGKVYFGLNSGEFLCLDFADGDFNWKYTTSKSIESSPAVYDEMVYFGSNDEFFYCLDADDGDLIWNYNTSGKVQSSPAIAYGNVYIGSTDRGLYCFDADSGDLVWEKFIEKGVWSPPSLADDKVYFGAIPCCGDSTYLLCYNAHDGEYVWRYNTEGGIGMKSSPAIAAGNVFIGSANGKVIAFGKEDFIADTHGPYTGIKDEPIQFEGNAYGGGPEYKWYWDFGDGETSDEQNPIHTYSDAGNYFVTLIVTDIHNKEAIDETEAFIEEGINLPPITPVIEGPSNGKIGKEYTYCIPSAVDPNEDDIYVFWDWGDGTNSDWTGPYASGEKICDKHIWNEAGGYTIKAMLKDEDGAESDWGYLEVNIPISRAIHTSFFKWFLVRFPLLIRLVYFLV